MWIVKTADGTLLFMCTWQQCSNAFKTVDELDAHLDQHLETYFSTPQINSQETTPCCQIRGCGIGVAGLDEFSRHIKMHIFHSQKVYEGYTYLEKCADAKDISSCNFPFSSRVVYQGDALSCEWDECQACFTDINEFVQHIGQHLAAIPVRKAEKNGKYGSRELKPLKCRWGIGEDKCQLEFRTKDSLRFHIQSHSGDKLCACPFCGGFFCTRQKLMDHVMRRQIGSEEFLCSFCKKCFKNRRLLETHCRRHIKNSRCPQCDVAMNSDYELKRHVSSVHAKNKNFACEFCDKSFFQKSDLKRHQEMHFRDTTFACPVCQKSYRWEKQLRYHMKSHDEGFISNPYCCHLCSQRYSRGYYLSKHLTSAHHLPIPTGFLRFTYKQCADGMYRLQTKHCLEVEPQTAAGGSSDFSDSEEA